MLAVLRAIAVVAPRLLTCRTCVFRFGLLSLVPRVPRFARSLRHLCVAMDSTAKEPQTKKHRDEGAADPVDGIEGQEIGESVGMDMEGGESVAEEEEGEEEADAGEGERDVAEALADKGGAGPPAGGVRLKRIPKSKSQRKKERKEAYKQQKKHAKERKAVGGADSSDARKTKMDSDMARETTPYTDGIYRRVVPYDYVFRSSAKGRWIGRQLLDLFRTEFQAETEAYYAAAIASGRVTVNGKPTSDTHILQNGDCIEHHVHRHEPPVTAAPLKIVYQDDRYVVVDKPASIPVHPCGRYRHLSIVVLLGHDHGLWDMYPCHRLDRLTSGILIFAKNKRAAAAMEAQIAERSVQKEYICRVAGRFPEGRVKCEEPILVVNFKVGLCSVSPQGKPCSTEFELVRYDPASDTSVVKCKPETGRMHQIRVHLQFLGHWIANDPLYNAKLWGARKGASFNLLTSTLPAQVSVREGDLNQEDMQLLDHVVDSVVDDIAEVCGEPLAPEEAARQASYRETCSDCKLRRPDPTPDQMCIYLHAFRYVGEGWEYHTDMPFWAADDYVPQVLK